MAASLQACGVVFPFAMPTSICRSIVTICSGLYLWMGMTCFSSKWILSHSTWYKFRRSGHLGESVSTSDNTILAGGYGNAKLFVQPAGGWTDATTQTAQLSDRGGREECNVGCFGWSVSISDNIAVVGAPGYSSKPGPTFSVADIFHKPGGGWSNMTENFLLQSPVDDGNTSYAWSVAVSGRTVVVGYPQLFGCGSGTSCGSVAYVY